MDARTDRRQIHYEDQPEVREHARSTTSQILRLRIELAKDLWSLDQTAAFLAESCSSVGHFAARYGLDAGEAFSLRDAGRAFELLPELEAQVLSLAIPCETPPRSGASRARRGTSPSPTARI
jgi:hypothetical protein